MIYLEIWTLASTLSFWLYDDMQLPLFSSTYFWAFYICVFHYYFESLCIIKQNFLGMCDECLRALVVDNGLEHGAVDLLCCFVIVTYLGTTVGKFGLAFGAERVGSNVCLQF